MTASALLTLACAKQESSAEPSGASATPSTVSPPLPSVSPNPTATLKAPPSPSSVATTAPPALASERIAGAPELDSAAVLRAVAVADWKRRWLMSRRNSQLAEYLALHHPGAQIELKGDAPRFGAVEAGAVAVEVLAPKELAAPFVDGGSSQELVFARLSTERVELEFVRFARFGRGGQSMCWTEQLELTPNARGELLLGRRVVGVPRQESPSCEAQLALRVSSKVEWLALFGDGCRVRGTSALQGTEVNALVVLQSNAGLQGVELPCGESVLSEPETFTQDAQGAVTWHMRDRLDRDRRFERKGKSIAISARTRQMDDAPDGVGYDPWTAFELEMRLELPSAERVPVWCASFEDLRLGACSSQFRQL